MPTTLKAFHSRLQPFNTSRPPLREQFKISMKILPAVIEWRLKRRNHWLVTIRRDEPQIAYSGMDMCNNGMAAAVAYSALLAPIAGEQRAALNTGAQNAFGSALQPHYGGIIPGAFGGSL